MADNKNLERLTCSYCPSTRFIRILNLRYSANGGSVDEPAGLRCADCAADVDVRKMVERRELDKKRRELLELEEELKDATHGSTVSRQADLAGASPVSVQGEGSRGSKKS